MFLKYVGVLCLTLGLTYGIAFMKSNVQACGNLEVTVQMGLCPHSQDLSWIFSLYICWFIFAFFSLFAFKAKLEQYSEIFDIENCTASD